MNIAHRVSSVALIRARRSAAKQTLCRNFGVREDAYLTVDKKMTARKPGSYNYGGSDGLSMVKKWQEADSPAQFRQ